MLGTDTLLADVGKVRSDLAALCSALDPDAVPLPEATPLWETFDAIARLAAGAKCRLARRVEESRSWQAHGARSAAEHLGALSGTTTGRARAELESSKALAALPAADAAVAKGELSDQQAEAITQAAKADPGAEARLVALAKRRDLRRLREECARTQARAEDEAARAERLRRQRSLRTWTAADGSWNLLAKHTPEVGAQIEAALAPLKEAIFQGARRAGHHESGEAYAADALAEMARRSVAADDAVAPAPPTETGAGVGGATAAGGGASSADGDGNAKSTEGHPTTSTAVGGDRAGDTADAASDPADPDPDTVEGAEVPGGEDPEGAGSAVGEPAAEATTPARRPARSRRPDTKVIVLISYEALKRGLAEAGETCEIAGVGPVPVATVRSLMGDAFGAAIVTDGVDVFTVAHLGRSVTAHQRSALEARGYRCEVPGCGATTALEIDHIEEWHRSFRTKLEALGWLCRPHHWAKTNGGWRLEGPPGDRRWVPPGDAGGQPDAPGPEPPGQQESLALKDLRFDDPSAA